MAATSSRRAVGHQACDGQFDQRNLLPVLPDGDAAANLAQPVRGQRHIRAAGANDDHVVAVMRHGRGHRHLALVAKARDEAVHNIAGRPVPFDQRDLADVICLIALHNSVYHRQIGGQRLGRGLIFDHADDLRRRPGSRPPEP